MPLPSIIEYLLARSDLEENWGILDDTIQIVIANIPPLNIIRYAVVPLHYMHIIYNFSFGPAVVPNALAVKKTTGRGSQLFNSVITGRVYPEITLATITPGAPLFEEVTNTTGLNQYYESTHYYIDIPNAVTFKEVIDVLHALIRETNPLQQEAKSLLRRMS